MTAVVPMTVRRRRCSERLSDSTRLAPCQETNKRASESATVTLRLHQMALTGNSMNLKNILTSISNTPALVAEVNLRKRYDWKSYYARIEASLPSNTSVPTTAFPLLWFNI